MLVYRALEFCSPLVGREADGGDCTLTIVDWNRKSIPNAEPGGFFKEFPLKFGPSSRSEPKTPPKGSSIADGLADHWIEPFVVAPQVMRCPGWRIGRDELGGSSSLRAKLRYAKQDRFSVVAISAMLCRRQSWSVLSVSRSTKF